MPTVLRSGPYRFHFYSSDAAEPRHVHVERDEKPVFFLRSARFGSRAVAVSDRVKSAGLTPLVAQHREALLRSWDAYFTE